MACEDIGLDLANAICALDCHGDASPQMAVLKTGYLPSLGSSTINLSLILFPWATLE